VDDLGESIHSFVEAVVESMDEHQHFGPSSLFRDGGDRFSKGLLVNILRRDWHEIRPRITWEACRPLNFANLPCRIGRDRNGDSRIGDLDGALATEHLALIGRRTLPGRRNKNRDERRAFGSCRHRNEGALRKASSARAAGQR
jgi:hypothetical protein